VSLAATGAQTSSRRKQVVVKIDVKFALEHGIKFYVDSHDYVLSTGAHRRAGCALLHLAMHAKLAR
jgi:hypothetical protein